MDGCMPIIEVTDDNFLTVLPTLKRAIEGASFLAVDCELTGIGERKKINDPEIDVRYTYTAEVARSHAVIALGLSCFTCKSVSNITLQEGQRVQSHDYLVQTFNILTLYSGSFMVECKAHKFLLDHGFDFNKLYAKGLQYYKGCDKQPNEAPNVRHLFSAMVEHKKPVVIHNGLMDLAFLYQSFYADLPKKMDTFAADLTDMFPTGIYDTKYIAEFHQMLPATYLEYLYKKMLLKNMRLGEEGKWHVRVKFPPYPRNLANVEWHPYQQILSYSTQEDRDDREMCNIYAFHGWCNKGKSCEKSHNVNRIVKTLQVVGAKKGNNSTAMKVSLTDIIQNQANRTIEGGDTENKSEEGEGKKKKKKNKKRKLQLYYEEGLEEKIRKQNVDENVCVKENTVMGNERNNDREIGVTKKNEKFKIVVDEEEKMKIEDVNNIVINEGFNERVDDEMKRKKLERVVEEETRNKLKDVNEEEIEKKVRVDKNERFRTDNILKPVEDVNEDTQNRMEIIVRERKDDEEIRVTSDKEVKVDVHENGKMKQICNESEINDIPVNEIVNNVIDKKREMGEGEKVQLTVLGNVSEEHVKEKMKTDTKEENDKIHTINSVNVKEKTVNNKSSATNIKSNNGPDRERKSDSTCTGILTTDEKVENDISVRKSKLEVIKEKKETENETDYSHSCNGHRAGFDAFMTGFIFACHVSNTEKLSSTRNPFTTENIGMSKFVNKVYLMGKNFPFLVRAGTFANMSTNHALKILKLRKEF